MTRSTEEYMAYQRELFKSFTEVNNTKTYDPREEEPWQVPEGFDYQIFFVDGIRVEKLIPQQKKVDTVVFHIHGGKYGLVLDNDYRNICPVYSNVAGGAEVVSVDYRTAKPYTHTTALEDCVKVYTWLLEEGYSSQNIIFIGDSVGATLTLITALYLKDHDLQLPKGIVAMSPWGNLGYKTESRVENIDKDLILDNNALDLAGVEIIAPTLEESTKAWAEIQNFINDISNRPIDEKRFCQEQQKFAYKASIKVFDEAPQGVFIKDSTWQVPEGYKLEKIEVEGVMVEHLVPLEKTTDRVIYQLHGGGYVVPFIDTYRDVAVYYSKMAGGAEVFTIDYRTAPTDVFPAAMEDAIKVYKWLLDQGYDNKNIVFAGDSAGGNLVLVTALGLKDQNIPLPNGIIAISPWSRIGIEADSFSTNITRDSLLGIGGTVISKAAANPEYFFEMDFKKPYISPYYGDFKGYPNLLIQIGSFEILLDDAVKTGENARAAGANVTISVYEKMSHVFQLLLPNSPEGRIAWKEMSDFVDSIFN